MTISQQTKNTPTLFGKTTTVGFKDPDSIYPKREYNSDSDVNLRIRGEIRKNESGSSSKRGPKVSSKVSRNTTRILNEKIISNTAEYPWNRLLETESGHIIEYDDTPGNERINIQHKTGSKFEIFSDGSIVTHAKNNLYTVTCNDSNAIISGICNVIIESSANIRVQGDANIETNGDLNTLVQGNYNFEVQGNMNQRVHGNYKLQTTGGYLNETRGNKINRNLSNYLERTVGNHTSEYGGNWKTTTEGEIHQRSYGQFQGSYYGGFITINGKDKNNNIGIGNFESNNIFGTTFSGKDLFFDGEGNFGTTLKVKTSIASPTFEGTAKTADFAITAGQAPLGTSVPTIPNPDQPTPSKTSLTSPETVSDVTGTSDTLILNLDRQPVTGYNNRYLNTTEVIVRCRNNNLRYDTNWLQDQIDSGAILDLITNIKPKTSPKRICKQTENNLIRSETNNIFNTVFTNVFKKHNNKQLFIRSFPDYMIENSNAIAKSTQISPNFKVSHMLGCDSLSSNLISQMGLTPKDIILNTQFIGYNILEPLFNKYGRGWSISEGIYNLLPNEKIDPNNVIFEYSQGLGVGIQLSGKSQSYYFDIAAWIMNNLIYDKLILSYIDYDPAKINEPTIIITVNDDINNKEVYTEFNHEKIFDNGLADYSNSN